MQEASREDDRRGHGPGIVAEGVPHGSGRTSTRRPAGATWGPMPVRLHQGCRTPRAMCYQTGSIGTARNPH